MMKIGEEGQGGRAFFGCCNGSFELDGLDDGKMEILDFWESTKDAELHIWVVEEAGPVVGVCAGEGVQLQHRETR